MGIGDTRHSIYLDNAATTRPADEVIEAMTEALRAGWANPSSIHRAGQAVRRDMDLARASVAGLIGCEERELVFVSGGTEAANLAIRGALGAQPGRRVLVTSRLEHSAVRELAESLAGQGVEVVWLGNDERGLVDLDALRLLLEARAAEVALVSIMWVNNETGVIQPVEAIGRLCREHGVRFHTDATQRAGKMPVDVRALSCDMLSFAAHKFHGPKGIGALYVRRGLRVQPQVVGGPQERSRRAGTENVPAIIGFGVAARLSREWLEAAPGERLAGLRDGFERGVIDRLGEAFVNGGAAPRSWDIANLAFARVEAEPLLLMLSERGLCASAGAACASGSIEPSPVLRAMGVPPDLADGSVRFSLCRGTTALEIGAAVDMVVEAVSRLRAALALRP